MIHLRLVVLPEQVDEVREELLNLRSVYNLVYLPGAVAKPEGDLLLCDVASEDSSLVIARLVDLGIPESGSISVERMESQLSLAAEQAELAAAGVPTDSVVWQEVEGRLIEESRLSASYLVLMILATVIAMSGIVLDSAILIVGAMAIGPEFTPIAALCLAIIQRGNPQKLVRAALLSLLVGFSFAIATTYLFVLVLKLFELVPETFDPGGSNLAGIVAHPDHFSLIVALCAGTAGMVSLTTGKAGALVGVLISVTTIPAAADIALAAAYADWSTWVGSQLQLAINLAAILASGTATLAVQRLFYRRRVAQHR